MLDREKGVLAASLMVTFLFGCDGGGSSRSGVAEDGADAPETTARLTMAETAVLESAGLISGTIELDQSLPVDTSFTLTEKPVSDKLNLPSDPILISAKADSASFQVTISDDNSIDGLQTYTLTATSTADSQLEASAVFDVLDDDDLPRLTTQKAHWEQTGNFLAATDCGSCHQASEINADPAALRTPENPGDPAPSPDGEDISPSTGWKSSVMANAFTDPYFRAAVAHETEQFPELAGFVEDKCLTCHSPMARTHAHKTGEGLQNDYYPMTSALTDPHAREGISCSLCHQITDDVVNEDINSGHYNVTYGQTIPLIYGPYQNPVKNAMQNAIGFEPEFGQHMSDSRLCGSCHELFTPVIDHATGQPNGEVFPEQTPYTEWTLSDFGPQGVTQASCQDCHMARDDIGDNFLTRLAVNRNDGSVNLNWPERGPYSPHEFLGGNTWLLETLELFREELGRSTINQPGDFAKAAERTRAFLQTAATLEASGAGLNQNALSFQMTIRNHSGHKLPTSFPSRRIWLATRVTDARGVTVFESGIPDGNSRLLSDKLFTRGECLAAKKPTGFDSSTCFSAHVDQVTSADQVPVYETVLQTTTGNITHILLYASEPLKDNRIPPRGFNNDDAPGYVKPAGVEGDNDFNTNGSGTDTVSYQLPIAADVEPPLEVEATLYYQSIRPTFINSIRGKHESISQFRTAAELNPPPAEILSTLSFTVN
ncbi:hypothetical protein ACFOZ5_08860 [Marinobacter lacisalsi]|uniref:Cytochrome c-552/4 domain-containing protein n=1 Tax=Marinobacter lacisalsi TaxID=475979 RepID=A0ABV8QHS7_9GAMM